MVCGSPDTHTLQCVSMCDYGHFTKPKEKKVYLEATQHLHTGRPQLDGVFNAVKPSSLKPHGVEV